MLMDEQQVGAIIRELGGEKASWHIPDEVRIGVLAGAEEYERWLQAHLLRCQGCCDPLIALLDKLAGAELTGAAPAAMTCSQARNAIFHYLESGREPAFELLRHVVTCEACSEPFYEPAKARVLLEHEPEDVGEAG